MVKSLKNEVFSEILENLDLIPLKKFIGIYLERLDNSSNLERGLALISLLNEFHDLMKKNIEIVSQYSEILESVISLLRFNSLLKEKENFLIELEITEEYKKSSDNAAISDLLKKLNKSINDNKKKGGNDMLDWLANLEWYWIGAIVGAIVFLLWYFVGD